MWENKWGVWAKSGKRRAKSGCIKEKRGACKRRDLREKEKKNKWVSMQKRVMLRDYIFHKGIMNLEVL